MMLRTLILDLDGSLPEQPPIARRISAGRAELHSLRSLGPSLRLWSFRPAYTAFQTFWSKLSQRSGTILALTGSGDFHHLTATFVGAAAGPLTVIHFDNHPDRSWSMPRRHCGSWVNEVLAMPHVERVLTIGPCSEDIAQIGRSSARREAASAGKLQVFPWRRPAGKAGSNTYHHQTTTPIVQPFDLAVTLWSSFLDHLASRIPTKRVWITIDKDVLAPSDAVTNWDQGELPLENLIAAIRFLGERFQIVGADICGDYAPIDHVNPLKSLEARIDQPRGKATTALEVNAATNERLIAAFEELV